MSKLISGVSRRSFTVGALLAAGTAGLPIMVKAQGGKTVALLFDSLVSPFWVSGIEIMREEAGKRGWETLEAISDFDDNRQFEQVRAMIERQVDGILIIQTDANAVIPAIRAAN
jgi:ABC-type sugar transport system substrate-binding protein